MKSLCITGLVQEDLNFMMQVLQEAGLAVAKPAARDTSMTIEYWHEQVLKLPMVRYTEDADGAEDAEVVNSKMGFSGRQSSGKAIKSQEIGRLWEQLASDIFISNLTSEAWGWADVRSTEVLPFWKRFDPQTRFLLVSVRPERFIAHHIETSDERLAPDVLLGRWVQFHQALLRFHQEHRDISLLVDFDDCVSQPGALIKACNEHFGLGLEIKHFPDVTRLDVSDIARFLAAEICSAHKGHKIFALDLEASLVPVGASHVEFSVPVMTDLIARYRDLKGELQEGRGGLKSELDRVKSEFEQLKAREVESKEENDLLLAQLHQVQEELESYFLKHKEVSDQLEPLKKQPKPVEQKPVDEQQVKAQAESLKKLQQELEQAKKDAAAKKKELDDAQAKHKQHVEALNKELATLKTTHQQLVDREKDTQEENDLLLAQLHQVQEELENYFLKYQDSDAKVQSIETRLARLVARHPDDILVESIEIVSVENLDAVDESGTNSGADVPVNSARGRARASRQTLAKSDSTSIISTSSTSTATAKTRPVSPTLHWRITGLEVGAELHDEIQFASFIEAGVACLVFKRNQDGVSVFKRWPGIEDKIDGKSAAQGEDNDTVVITTVGDETTGPSRARTLKDLSGTDWQLVKTLVALVTKELAEPKLLKLPSALVGQSGPAGSAVAKGRGTTKVQATTKGRAKSTVPDSGVTRPVTDFAIAFAQLEREFDQLPPLLHFDGLRLGYVQEEPEYEFLTFAFEKAWYGDRMLPEFEFRFASVNVPAGSFGSNPRLEFHEGRSKAAFESWFEESRDDYGPKLELRFAQPNAMDIEVWDRLVPNDQSLVAALIAQLPVFMDHVKSDSRSIYRSWDDWIKLADDVHRILLLSTGGFASDDEGTDGSDAAVEDVEFVDVIEHPGENSDVKKPASRRKTGGATARSRRSNPVTRNRKAANV
jgi:hypothetical protein